MEFLAESLSAPGAALAGLFLSSFLAATLLPGGSELALYALIRTYPEALWQGLALATVGNTMGSMSTWWMAKHLPGKMLDRLSPRHLAQLRRWGPIILLMAWSPLVGDALCVAAGWLRLAALPCLFWIGLGKGLRYGLVAAGALAF